VQFDFPNIEGKPYKSSGGELDYIDLLKREIPESWELVSLNDFVAQRISGDWGNETETTQNSIKVSCIRGADLKTLEDLPTRFIADNHINRLLKPLNVIIEMSGGSPTQSTGRSAIILKETIDDNNNAVVCSNFCQAISPLKEFELYFYFTWQLLYNNNVFFNFEGKTSGLRNLQLDNVLNIKWYKPNIELIKQFNSIGLNYLEETARNKRLIRRLTKLRDELLPMLLNGQVNCDLVYIGITKFHQ
jgi:type I restriction enzyme S subunit